MKRESAPATSGPDDVALDYLARNVEKLRAAAGWSLTALARRSGVGASQVKHIVYRRANPTLADVLRLADAFGVSTGDLTDGEIEEGLTTVRASAPRHAPTHVGVALGARVRAWRLSRRMATRRFAALANVAENTVRAVEGGEAPSTRVAARIAAVLGMTMGALLQSVRSPVLAFAAKGPDGDGNRRELLHDTSAGDSLSLEEWSLRRGQSVHRPAAGTAATTMAYALAGCARIAFESEAVTLQAGEAALLVSDRPFVVTAMGNRPVRLLFVLRTAGGAPVEK